MQQFGLQCLAPGHLNSGMRDEQVWEDQRPDWGGGSFVLSEGHLSNYFNILFPCDHEK